MEPVLAYRDRTFVNFRSYPFDDPRDHGFRWIDIKHFALVGAVPGDESVLRALIGDDRFADDYAGGGAESDRRIHGPYRRDRITPDAYHRLDAASAIATLGAWAGRHGGLPASLAETLEEQLYIPFRRATALYRLHDLGESARHDWALHDEFIELVVVDNAAGAVSLVVATDD